MIFPLPPGVRPPPAVSPAAMAPLPRPRPVEPLFPPQVQRRPGNDVRMLPAISPEDVHAVRRKAVFAEERDRLLGKHKAAPPQATRERPWYEDPVALGTLLILVPPIGLAALWSSKRYSNDARWALTLMTALTLCLGVVLIIVVLALRA